MKKNKSNKLLIWQVKNSALQLRKNYQLPFYLTTLIYGIGADSKVDYVRCLMNLVKHLLRVKGYYKENPQADKDSKDFVIKYLSDMGF